MSFGMHLFHKGRITLEQLLAALKQQQRLTTPLYLLAVDHGFLSVEQVVLLLDDADHQFDLSFAELANQLALLTGQEVETLFELQRRSRPRLGVVLVRQGVLTLHEAQHELQLYLSSTAPDTSASDPPIPT
ncbi:MAG: hypothetical protein AAFX99_18585 [Myxococcota bacterium]